MKSRVSSTLQQRGLQHVWHPCSQMKDYETFLPLEIESAQGSYIQLQDGRSLIDAVSSWWCKSLGHGHPVLKQALQAQADKFEHVILANTINRPIVDLSEKLAQLCPPLDKVSFASDGSCAVEMAMKVSLHAHQLKGMPQRTDFMALRNGYHGETAAAMAVTDLGLYRAPYVAMLPNNVHFLEGLPYVSGTADPLWENCEAMWPPLEAQLNQHADTLTAIIVEPVLQGAGSMSLYSPDVLRRLSAWAKARGIHMIADEILTGIGRTGTALACEHAGLVPDFICLSKGLTSGWLPLSVMMTSAEIYDLFYDDHESGKAFLHSHTYTGNTLGVAVANACLDVMASEQIYAYVQNTLAPHLQQRFTEVANQTGKLHNLRHLGAMVAADLVVPGPGRLGYEICQAAARLGALIRPLGNTLYWVPPLNTTTATIDELADITQQAITDVLG